MPQIVYIDPVGPEGACPLIKDELDKIKRRETRVEFTHLKRGPQHLEYRYYESLIIPDLLHTIKDIEEKGNDAAVIGCFYDPGLSAAREITRNMVVTAPAEASFHLASKYGSKFSIIIGREKWIARITENLINYGFEDKLASFKTLEMGVLDFHTDPKHTEEKLKEKALEAVKEDKAEVIILGCTMQFGFYKQLQEHINVPVIDPIIAAFKYAEFLVELRNSFGWITSKKYTFEMPPDEEIDKWKIREIY